MRRKYLIAAAVLVLAALGLLEYSPELLELIIGETK